MERSLGEGDGSRSTTGAALCPLRASLRAISTAATTVDHWRNKDAFTGALCGVHEGDVRLDLDILTHKNLRLGASSAATTRLARKRSKDVVDVDVSSSKPTSKPTKTTLATTESMEATCSRTEGATTATCSGVETSILVECGGTIAIVRLAFLSIREDLVRRLCL